MTDTGSGLHNMDTRVTEWKPFRLPDLAMMLRLMKGKLIFDGGPERKAARPAIATRVARAR